ncbi:MAG: EF-hand domain-containing protein [Desulfobulbaceae bacterium]|uniref:EF-hand domain-containing protein n=1 Tax=Candidatus Desulfatifera sulfidica TaxID=2841691 RepID=A0A8J6N555_9BACT|nr:EF-hand domain-containing protein [Candidatus Desulfatifera sulfidica]
MKISLKIFFALIFIYGVALATPTAQQKFSKADTNGDGILDSKEFYNDLSRKKNQKIKEGRALKGYSTAPQFDQVDANHDGQITFKEYDQFHAERQHEMADIRNTNGDQGKGLQLFQQYDRNNDGCIDKNEFSRQYKTTPF